MFSLGGIIQRWPAVLLEQRRPCLSGDGTLFFESLVLSPLLSEFHLESPSNQGKDRVVPQLRGVTEKRPSCWS